ncbi:MAG: hypothetical protein RIM99_04600 [Cyclobacteriaceae bacterium]
MREYNLTLVKEFRSILAIVGVVLVFVTALILLAINFPKSANGFVFLMTLLLFFAIFAVLLNKFFDRILVKYNFKVVLTDVYIKIDKQQYPWSEVIWHRVDSNSAIFSGFTLKVKNQKSPIKLVINKKSNQHSDYQELVDDLVRTISEKQPESRNYYQSAVWRKVAVMLLVSNLILPLVVYILDYDLTKMIPFQLIWLAITLSTSISIFKNQKK